MCDFLADISLPAEEQREFCCNLLELAENQGCFYYHYIIFEIIIEYLSEDNDNAIQLFASDEQILKSSHINLVHSPHEESWEQHRAFTRLRASNMKEERFSIRKAEEFPPWLDILFVETREREAYVRNLDRVGDEDAKDFFASLYRLFIAALIDLDIMTRDHFFIYREKVETVTRESAITHLKNKEGVFAVTNHASSLSKFLTLVDKLYCDNDFDLSTIKDLRKTYLFLLDLFCVSKTTLLNANLVDFLTLIFKYEHLGTITKCEILASIVIYDNLQQNRMSAYLCRHCDELKEIIERHSSSKAFDCEAVFASLINSGVCFSRMKNHMRKELANAKTEDQRRVLEDEMILVEDLPKVFVAACKKNIQGLPDYFDDLCSVIIGAGIQCDQDQDIAIDLLGKLEAYTPDLVAWILNNIVTRSEAHLYLVEQCYETLTKSTLTSVNYNIISYLEWTGQPFEAIRDKLDYLHSEIDKCSSKSTLVGIYFITKKL